MASFLYRTPDNSSVEHKSRVYFTCHPEDFNNSFEKICNDIFRTHSCAIFYTPDMAEEIEEKYLESDLGQMDLFVIPVTHKLLNKPNRAMDSDFFYAKAKKIPVLPIMMEPGLDGYYSLPYKFGELQYLDRYAKDTTAISYEEKLKKYLEAVLISDLTAKMIRNSFDAYIFLSYRKKDRHYANELMKMIHSHPEFRDIAIWYDEFLTPGESFRENIEQKMRDSKLFALLVTPSLLEYVDGEPNYVMAHEYPDAKKAGMNILPTEMEETDKELLRATYEDIPECVDPKENSLLKKHLADNLSGIAVSANNNDPEHHYLIGLAYLEGIDVEKNPDIAVELITSAAEAGELEAMRKLYDIYQHGIGVHTDYPKAAFWAERIVEYGKKNFGEDHIATQNLLNNLAFTYCSLGRYREALAIQEEIYELQCKTLGEENHFTLSTLNNLAGSCYELGMYTKALELQEKTYSARCRILGKGNEDTLIALKNLARTYRALGEHKKALQLLEEAYDTACGVLGSEHRTTLETLASLAITYYKSGDLKNALELLEKAYELFRKTVGEEDPDTLAALSNLAPLYNQFGQQAKALDLTKKAYFTKCRVLGKDHPSTLTTLNNLAYTYNNNGNHQKALELFEEALKSMSEQFGEMYPDNLTVIINLIYTCKKLGNHKRTTELYEKLYALRCSMLGEEHPDTLKTLEDLAFAYSSLGNYQKEMELDEKLYLLRLRILGEDAPETVDTLGNLVWTHNELGNYRRSAELCEKLYSLRIRLLGEEHPKSVSALNELTFAYRKLGNIKRANELSEKYKSKLTE